MTNKEITPFKPEIVKPAPPVTVSFEDASVAIDDVNNLSSALNLILMECGNANHTRTMVSVLDAMQNHICTLKSYFKDPE